MNNLTVFDVLKNIPTKMLEHELNKRKRGNPAGFAFRIPNEFGLDTIIARKTKKELETFIKENKITNAKIYKIFNKDFEKRFIK